MTDGNDGNAESANLQEQMAQMMALAQQQQQSITQLTAAVDANSKAMEEQRAAMQQQLANVAPSGLAHGTPGLGTAAAAAAPQGLLASMSAALPARNLSRFFATAQPNPSGALGDIIYLKAYPHVCATAST